MSSIVEQYAKQEAAQAAEAERRRAQTHDLKLACTLLMTGKLTVPEAVQLFEIDNENAFRKSCNLQST